MTEFAAADLQALSTAVSDVAPGLAALLTGASPGIAVSALGRVLLFDAQAALPDILAEAQKDDAGVRSAILVAEQSCGSRLRTADPAAALPPAAPVAPAPAAPAAVKAADPHPVVGGGVNLDTENARQMQIKTHDKVNKNLAYIVTFGFFLLILVLIFSARVLAKPQYSGSRDILFTLMGVVGTGWATIIGFYFGSSAGSAQKSQTLGAALASAQQNAANAIKAVSGAG
jgi:hypothetical protein